ncbi:hypothetical protein CVT24_003700 [Panaeolus cyanescens]|uniref:G domain-containing protein n=1 Tax=Panaeolus cyanescens TaxID=181874 RepID=A0A409WC45_9AGAR|nr:hypothetical protein CVT24_003700 [Panaeolus cyanescens]
MQVYRPHHYTEDVYIIDTPGFVDNNMSEFEVVKKIETWQMESQHGAAISQYLYFHRITDKRIPGRAKKVMQMLKSTGLGVSTSCLTVVTSMWDNIHTSVGLQRAQDNFLELQNVIWKDHIESPSQIVKFVNTHTSAIRILTTTSYNTTIAYPINTHSDIPGESLTPILFQELIDRIGNTRLEHEGLSRDVVELITNINTHRSPDSDTDEDLISTLISALKDARHRLSKYINQLYTFKRAPRGFTIDPKCIIYQCLVDITSGLERLIQAIQAIQNNHLAVQDSEQAERDSDDIIIMMDTVLRSARNEFGRSYNALKLFGAPPPGFEPFVPSITLHTSERVKWGVERAVERLHHWQFTTRR